MKTQRKWCFLRESFLLILLTLTAELQASSNFSDESSIEDPTSPRHGQPSLALSRKEWIEPEAEDSTDLEEDELSSIRKSKSFNGPTEFQIAQARKLILHEGKDGDSTPFNLQEIDLDNASQSTSSFFSFRLTNSSFLDALHDKDLFSSFSNLRKVIDDEQGEEKRGELHEDSDSSKNALINETDSQSSASDLIEKDKRLLAEMISKKTGFAFRTSGKDFRAKQVVRSDDGESQNLAARIPAPPPICPPGSGLCRSLRERLLEDLVSSYSDPFTSRIRYRLKRKPSVYTTRLPKIRNDIGIPDIYETEVTVMPHVTHNLSAISSGSNAPSHDHSVTAPPPGHRLHSSRRPPLSLGAIKQRAREQSEAKEATKTRSKGANKIRSKNRDRESQAAMRRYLTRRGYGHPARMRTRTHLDYRRPVAFKFRRTHDSRKHAKHEIHHEAASIKRLPIHPLKMRGQEEILSSSSPSRALPSKTVNRHEQEDPVLKPDVLKPESSDTYSKVSAEKKSFKALPEHKNVEGSHSYEIPQANTETPMFYEKEAPDRGSDESYGIKNKYEGHDPPHDYEISPSPSPLRPKSATVPGWLMNLKDVARYPNPPPHHPPQRRSKPKQTEITPSPMPADYALKASNPSALPSTYTTASPQRDLREPQLKSHVSEKYLEKNAASYTHVSPPDHFRIINPRQEPAHSKQNPPPSKIHSPLEPELLPSKNTNVRNDQTTIVPYFPVIPSPDPTSGSKYSVKVTTPSAIYVTPVDVSSPPPYGKQSRPIYAPPSSPKSTYSPLDHLISVKPHLDANSHPYKAHISAADLRDHYKNISSHPIVTHLTPIKHEYIEHKVSKNSTTSHRIVTPKTHHVTVAPKFPFASAMSHTPKNFLESYTSPPVVPTTFKPSLPGNNLAMMQKHSVGTSTYSPPAAKLDPQKESSNQKALPEISLVPYVLEDYVTGHSYYDDYYDYYDDDYSYFFDDLYNYDYLLDVLGVAESRPLLPLHVLPETFPKGQLQNFGYIAGVPGRAGKDYPILGYIPDTSFGCGLVAEYPGYYADMDAGCQVFHVCHHDGTQDSYLCPNGTIFNQKYFVCDWWYNFNCEDAPFFYPVNAALSYVGLAVHDTRPYHDVPSSSLGYAGGNNRPRRGQNRRPTKRRVYPRKSFVQGFRSAARRQQALASTLHQVALAPRRQGGAASVYRAPLNAWRHAASEFPVTARVSNGTRLPSGSVKSLSGSRPGETWAVPAANNVTEAQE